MKKWYYIIFIAVLYFCNQAFQEYVMLYGLLEGLLVGLVIAFVCKFLFNMVTRTIVFIAVLAAIVGFLVSSGMISIPFDFLQVVQPLFM